jgi:hypothetical protein
MIVTLWNPGGITKPPKEPLKYAVYYSLFFLVFYLIVAIFLINSIGLTMALSGLVIFYVVTFVALYLWAIVFRTMYQFSKKNSPKLEK